MTTDDYGHGLRDVMELQRQSDEFNELLRQHLERSSSMSEHEREVAAEVKRQLIDGLPPSEGLPDCRPRRPRYVPEQKGEQQ